jgi:acylphosphatase
VQRAADLACRLLRVEGRVQGVGFREACVHQASSLGLAGWVRNRRDGTLEVLLQGAPDAVARMTAWLHEGPPLARVVRVTDDPAPPVDALLRRFERRPTA